jgi:aminomethyltransferase
MTQTNPSQVKRTPLDARHRALGARMMPYAGWEMPVEYSGLSLEHEAVRQRAGVFDVTHMGQIEVAGPRALEALQWVTSNDVSRLAPGQAHYSALVTAEGTFVDDLLVYRLGDTHFLLVVNAANTAKDVAWITDQTRPFGAAVLDTSARYALIALQGPLARTVMQRLVNVDLSSVRYYWFAPGEIASVRGTISRTGYTGEDGYELFVPPQQAVRVWDAILEEGRAEGVVPAGLGARDTLRLEAAMRLYGQDIDETTTILEADLAWILAWGKGDFLGREALARQKAAGVTRRLIGFEMVDRAIARHGHACYVGGEAVGRVTSGTQTPSLQKALGLAYLPAAHTAADTEFDIDIRGRRSRARVVPLPFYKRPRG